MPPVLLAPAAAIVVAVTVLAVLSARVTRELTELRRSLRHLGAIAVAGDELSRAVDHLGGRAAALRDEVPFRIGWSRAAPGDRRDPVHG